MVMSISTAENAKNNNTINKSTNILINEDIQDIVKNLAQIATEEEANNFDPEEKIKHLLLQSGFLDHLTDYVVTSNQSSSHSNYDPQKRTTHTQYSQKTEELNLPQTHQTLPISHEYEPNSCEPPSILQQFDLLSKNVKLDRNITFNEPLEKSREDSNIKLGKCYLAIKIQKGRAFLGVSDVTEDSTKKLEINILIGTQRFKSRATASSTEPFFGDQWIIELQQSEIEAILATYLPIHVILTRTDTATQMKQLIGSRMVEWRHVLQTGYLSLIVDLMDPQSSGQMSAGLLDMQFELLPRPSSGEGYWRSKEDINKQLRKEERSEMDAHKLFFMLVKQWWTEFLEIRNDCAQRLVKLFAIDECGRKLPVNSFIKPIRTYLISSPSLASRFVSLIPFQQHTAIGENKQVDIWLSPEAFLISFCGDVQDHAILLCNFLLGFSLRAYVTWGLKRYDGSPFVWVTTVNDLNEVWFWDSCNGTRYKSNTVGWAKTVGCCFNNNSFYANIQSSDQAISCDFNFDDQTKWKKIPEEVLFSVRLMNHVTLSIFPALHTATHIQYAKEIEISLKDKILLYRHTKLNENYQVSFDENLAFIVGQKLWEYEQDKICGNQLSATSDFEVGVKSLIPEGHIFQGFPAHFNHQNSSRIFMMLQKSKASRDILLVRGDAVKFVVRVSLFPYAEEAMATWVFLGVCFLPIAK